MAKNQQQQKQQSNVGGARKGLFVTFDEHGNVTSVTRGNTGKDLQQHRIKIRRRNQ